MSRSARRAVTGLLAGSALLGTVWIAEPFAPDPVVTPPVPAVLAAESRDVAASQEAQRTLLTAEDDRLLTLVASLRPDSAPYVQSVAGVETLVLTPRGLEYNLADLIEEGAAVRESEGVVRITQNVLVAPGAALTVLAPGTTLRLSSDRSAQTSLVAWKADLELAGAPGEPLVLTSWDPTRKAEDEAPENGRAYVRTASGRMDLTHVEASDLGFWAGRTGGVAFTGGSSGPASGSLTGSTFEDGHYGVFASETDGLEVADSRFVGNTVDGLSLHRRTVSTTITRSTATANGRHGLAAAQGSEHVYLTDVDASRNSGYGLYFSGSPLSEGLSAGGASLRAYGGYTVSRGELRDNGKGGMRIVEAADVTVVGTTLEGNRDGVVLVDTAAPTTVVGTTITGAHRFGVTASGGAATIASNHVIGADTPIRVRDASVAVTGNLLEDATNHGVSVVGASVATAVVDNTVTGRGPSGMDVHRLAPGVEIELSGNNLEDWVRDRDNWVYWSTFIPNHPMLVLWVVILGVPLILGVRAHRNRQPLGSSPYSDDIRRERPAPRRVDLGRPLSSGGPA